MADQLKAVFNEVLELRRSKQQQVRKAGRVRQHLDGLILDLWIASTYSNNPWRAISRRKEDYQKGTRYRKLFLKHSLLMGVLDDLVEMGYIDQKIGFHDRTTNKGYQTRIKCSDKLLSLISKFDVRQITRNPEVPEEETIIKKDASGRLVDYVDDRFTNGMREDLTEYNNMVRTAAINTDDVELRYEVDPTATTMRRVFNEEGGGRFYGGFWQQLSKEDRLKLKLDGEAVVEKDYVALHPAIAYSLVGWGLAFDPYTIEGCERGDVKKAFLCLFNCKSRKQAINTIRSEFHLKGAADLLHRIEQEHPLISDFFYNPPFGLMLQNTDSWLCEKVLKNLMKQNILALPVHDSFLVKKTYEQHLHDAMSDSAI
ncbi:hypothetical protein C8R31_104286 [Nitrosospira sp. Nsp2]|nr:hypothetical protein C8R31_104286 [Nitrosospira sp. Nsp2]